MNVDLYRAFFICSSNAKTVTTNCGLGFKKMNINLSQTYRSCRKRNDFEVFGISIKRSVEWPTVSDVILLGCFDGRSIVCSPNTSSFLPVDGWFFEIKMTVFNVNKKSFLKNHFWSSISKSTWRLDIRPHSRGINLLKYANLLPCDVIYSRCIGTALQVMVGIQVSIYSFYHTL